MYMDQSSIYNLLCSLLININNSMVFEMDTHLYTSKGSFTFWVWIPPWYSEDKAKYFSISQDFVTLLLFVFCR